MGVCEDQKKRKMTVGKQLSRVCWGGVDNVIAPREELKGEKHAKAQKQITTRLAQSGRQVNTRSSQQPNKKRGLGGPGKLTMRGISGSWVRLGKGGGGKVGIVLCSNKRKGRNNEDRGFAPSKIQERKKSRKWVDVKKNTRYRGCNHRA